MRWRRSAPAGDGARPGSRGRTPLAATPGTLGALGTGALLVAVLAALQAAVLAAVLAAVQAAVQAALVAALMPVPLGPGEAGPPEPGRATAIAAVQGAGPVVWPLPRRCFAATATGREVTSADRFELGGEGVVVAAYSTGSGLLSTPTRGSADECHHLLWRVVRHLYPAPVLRRVDRIVLYETVAETDAATDAGTSTDAGTGADDLLDAIAFVEPRDSTLQSWTLAVALPRLTDRELAQVLVHELAHLITLAPNAVELAAPAEDCTTYSTFQGCSRPGTLLAAYVSRFWPARLRDDWESAAGLQNASAREHGLSAFWRRHHELFATEYAATGPEEDLAETLAHWCVGARPDSPPLSTGALRRKAAFLGGRRELEGLRARCAAVR